MVWRCALAAGGYSAMGRVVWDRWAVRGSSATGGSEASVRRGLWLLKCVKLVGKKNPVVHYENASVIALMRPDARVTFGWTST